MAESIPQPIVAVKQIISTKTASQPTHSMIIEDWQLTGKYKRRPISQEEIDFINVNYLLFYTMIFITINIFFKYQRGGPQ